MSMGPHAASVAATLEEMRRRYAAMPDPALTADRHSRTITLALHEVVMPLLAADRDAGGCPKSDEAWAQGVTHALGNLLCSLASSLLPADTPEAELPRALISQTHMLMKATGHRAMLRAMDPSREKVVWHCDPAPAEGGAS